MDLFADLFDDLEPQARARSNTWPLRKPEDYVEPVEEAPTPPAPKKTSSRRNAWGNLSYADLITQAITVSPDKRLTLSQIYEWMVQNVPYFKDKGDSNSSAGWKNSIRHNLSLHNRFQRVQNESTGKSSWWMVNPDAEVGKSGRRRAASMETSKYEKRRGRVKKMVEVKKNGGLPDIASSPSTSVSEGLDMVLGSGPLQRSFEPFPGHRDFSQYTTPQCLQSCSCMQPHTPHYPEQPPDSSNSQYLASRNMIPKPSWNSSLVTHQPANPTPSTMIGQVMEVLTSGAVVDDLNINVELFQGGFECNVEELIKHELSLEGSIDFNFVNQQQNVGIPQVQDAISETSSSQGSAPSAYSTTVTRPSWVH